MSQHSVLDKMSTNNVTHHKIMTRTRITLWTITLLGTIHTMISNFQIHKQYVNDKYEKYQGELSM